MKSEEEKRKAAHEILDLVLDINSCNSRRKELTVDKPTAFFEFRGHVNVICADIVTDGWEKGSRPDISLMYYLDEEIGALKSIKEKLQEIKNSLK